MPRKPSLNAAKELFWRKAVVRYLGSGLSQAEFCKREDLNPNPFSWWKKTIAERDVANVPASAPPFAPVAVSQTTDTVAMSTPVENGLNLTIATQFSHR
jgi:hypothetical protein